MKPNEASRVLYQQAALRSFLRSDTIAQSFIEHTPNYGIEDLEQLYLASASIKSKKMLIEFVKISTKQLCISLRNKLPLFKYLNPDNISTDLTDDELMLLIHEASHSMSIDKFSGGHGNIAFLVAKNIIFNMVGVNATATLSSLIKTSHDSQSKSATEKNESNLPLFTEKTPSPPSYSFSSHPTTQFTNTSTPSSQSYPSNLTQMSSPSILSSTGMSSFPASSPAIISTSVANVSFVSINSSGPHVSNPFMVTSTTPSESITHSITQSTPIPAIEASNYDKPETVSTRFEIVENDGPNVQYDAQNNDDESSVQNNTGNYDDGGFNVQNDAENKNDGSNGSNDSEIDDDRSSVQDDAGVNNDRSGVKNDAGVNDDGSRVEYDAEINDDRSSIHTDARSDVSIIDSNVDREQYLNDFTSDSQMDDDDSKVANTEAENKSFADEIMDDEVFNNAFSSPGDLYETPLDSYQSDHENHAHRRSDINIDEYDDSLIPIITKKTASRKKATKRKSSNENYKDNDNRFDDLNDSNKPYNDSAFMADDFDDDNLIPRISGFSNQKSFAERESEKSRQSLFNFSEIINDLKENETNMMNIGKLAFNDARVSFSNIDA